MPKKGAVPVILLIVLVVVSLALAGGAFYLYQKERLKSLELSERMEDVNAKAQIIESKLEEAKKENSQLEIQSQESKSQIDFLNSELQTEKKAKQEIKDELVKVNTELVKEKKTRAETEEKLTQSQQMLKTLQLEFKDLEDKKSELEAKVKKQEDVQSGNIELGTIYVGQQESTAAATTGGSSSSEGEVLVVNKDYDFAVINLGSKDGVNLDDIFSVYRNEKYIGDMKIEKVHESMSAANFLSPDIKDKVRKGDKVRVKQNK